MPLLIQQACGQLWKNSVTSTKAVFEIVRADETISRDIKEILEICKLISVVRENPEMAFDEDSFQEIVDKKMNLKISHQLNKFLEQIIALTW